MKTEKKQSEIILITEVQGLDPIQVILEQISSSAGRIIIICYTKAWTSSWMSIGERSVSKFFCSQDEDYLTKCLSDVEASIIDYDSIAKKIGESGVTKETLVMFTSKIEKSYGPEWYINLPKKSNSEYLYLCRIIIAVQEALKSIK